MISLFYFFCDIAFLGQGVVLERTPHTDFIFANACRAKNYIGPECKQIMI